MKTIAIQIDAGDKYCDECQHLRAAGWCEVFGLYVPAAIFEKPVGRPRLPECLAAEQKAKGQDHG
jgi:hypothetical protein